MNNFEGQVVMITGAAEGIGKEAALQFGQHGAKLAICDINESALQKTTSVLKNQGVEVHAERCDVSKASDVESFITNSVNVFGKIDVALNNAGIDPDHHLITDMPLDDYQRTMDINVKGVFLCMKYQIPHMLKQGGGAICNTSSVAGVIAAPRMSAYAASKHAVIGLTKSAALEYGKQNIRVNAVCPFITMTNMFEQTLGLFNDREETIRRMTKTSGIKRAAEPKEVVRAMMFACDKDNTYMTGHELMVDGGLTAI